MNFSNTVWQHIVPIYNRILQHPFNRELADGKLDPKRFLFYMEQDAYYLICFSRSLSFIAARANRSKIIEQFLHFALGALVAERELHARFLPLYHCCDSIEPSPACMAYTQYLLATSATASLEEAIAAVLPCFWLYREVGQNICARTKKNNPYILWIRTYSSQEFFEVTERAISLFNDFANRSSINSLSLMKKAFEYCALFEWHFWNDAYHMVCFRSSA